MLSHENLVKGQAVSFIIIDDPVQPTPARREEIYKWWKGFCQRRHKGMYQNYIWWCRQVKSNLHHPESISRWREVRYYFLNDWSPVQVARVYNVDSLPNVAADNMNPE